MIHKGSIQALCVVVMWWEVRAQNPGTRERERSHGEEEAKDLGHKTAEIYGTN